jgi:predicted amidohydrolase YtcJ
MLVRTTLLNLACALLVPGAVLAANADIIWFGGPIITINDKAPSAQAVAVKDGKIVAVGSKKAVFEAQKGATTQLVDLKGRTLLPGFIDAHGHMSAVGLQAVAANLLPPPDGPVASIPELQKALRDYIAATPKVKDWGVVIGMNYDDSQLAEQRHPTRQELDAISAELPVLIIHQSGHLAVMNSVALAKVGITADSKDPPGGVIRREADGKTPNGVLEELALILNAPKLLPKLTAQQGLALIEAGQDIYLANGFTTAQEGRASAGVTAALRGAANAGKLKLDVVDYADLIGTADLSGTEDSFDALAGVAPDAKPGVPNIAVSNTYDNHFRVGGVKLTFDGSPQGKTAWFTKPYYKVPEGQKPDYAGYPAFPNSDEAQAYVDMAYKNHWQLMVHANGDAAIDELIKTVTVAQAKYGAGERRTVLIHGQYLRADQIPALKQLGIIPALYPMHTYYWGDWHRQSVAGPERAAFISPTAAVYKAGMKFTIHSDAPVTFPNSMRILDSAVNRTTRTGFVLGPDQRISPMLALHAMTLWPAYQHFEEASKGSIEVGKRADLVILDKDPLTVPRATLKDIKVIETIKDGKSVYLAL